MRWGGLGEVEWGVCPHLETGLEGKLQFAPFDDNVGEVEEVDLQWIQHSLPRHNDLLGLFLHRQ